MLLYIYYTKYLYLLIEWVNIFYKKEFYRSKYWIIEVIIACILQQLRNKNSFHGNFTLDNQNSRLEFEYLLRY